jgi:Flp pilus assembly pilin Flp
MVFKKQNCAATILEYVLIASTIVIVCITGFRNIGNGYNSIYVNISQAI